MALFKTDILGADAETPDAAGRSTQIPEDVRECEPDLANRSPYRLDAPAQVVEIIPRALPQDADGLHWHPARARLPIIIPKLSEDTGR